MKKVHGWILLTSLLTSPFCSQAFGQNYKNRYIIEAFKYYKTSSYSKALASLKKARGSQKILGVRYYLEGIILNRTQRYDEAMVSFENALRAKNKSPDLYYEFGQALYANSELVKARIAFKKSAEAGFKEASSLYYVAHISQLLEEHKVARDTYIRLIKTASSSEDKKLQQIARFQLSESFLALAENRDDASRLVDKYVIPVLNKAYDTLPKAPLAKDIQKRKKEIERQYGLDPNLMKNGRVLSKDRLSLRVQHEFRYDSNITLATDIPTARTLSKDTFIHETNFNMQYLSQAKGRFTFTPFARIRNTYHTDRESPTVYQNDTYNITVGSRNTYEHKLFGQQANFIFDIDYVYIGRNTQNTKERPFFSRATTLTFGERFRFFSFGPTTFKYQYKDYKASTLTLFNKTNSFSVDQIKSTKSGNLFIFLFRVDQIDQYNNPTASQDSYLFRTDYLIPEVFPTYTLNLAMSLSFLDVAVQPTPERGLEKTYTPSVTLRKKINKNMSANIGVDYTRNVSKDKTNFDYKKHVVRFGLSASY